MKSGDDVIVPTIYDHAVMKPQTKNSQLMFQNGNLLPRRSLLKKLTAIVTTTSTIAATTTVPSKANAFPFVPTASAASSHRQLELCLVNLLRVIYWAKYTADSYDQLASLETKKLMYLETRLSAKAMLTGKLGSGSTGKVYTLSSLQIMGCLNDLEWYATTTTQTNKYNSFQIQQIQNNKNRFIESLASLVEFDGFDTLQDPSPRSSLTLSQYNDTKLTYMKRTLIELIIPYGEKLVTEFGIEPLQIAETYIQQYYRSEIYIPKPVTIVDSSFQSTNVINDAIQFTDVGDDTMFDGSY